MEVTQRRVGLRHLEAVGAADGGGGGERGVLLPQRPRRPLPLQHLLVQRVEHLATLAPEMQNQESSNLRDCLFR